MDFQKIFVNAFSVRIAWNVKAAKYRRASFLRAQQNEGEGEAGREEFEPGSDIRQ